MKHTIRIQPTAGGIAVGSYSTLEFTHREEAASAFETLEKIGFDGTLELHLAPDTTTGTNRGICDRCGKERGLYPNTAGERICLGCWDEHDATPIHDPRDTGLETDCAPSYAVEYHWSGWNDKRVQHPCLSLEHARQVLRGIQEREEYSGPYRILETRCIHSEN